MYVIKIYLGTYVPQCSLARCGTGVKMLRKLVFSFIVISYIYLLVQFLLLPAQVGLRCSY